MLPPSTVVILAVVFSSSAWCRKASRHVLRRHFALKQIAAHIFFLGEPARLGALRDEVLSQQAGTDTVGVDCVGRIPSAP